MCEILVVVGLDVALGTMVDMILEGTDDCVRRIGRVLFQHRSHETIQIELTATSSIKDAKCHFVNREEKERSDVDEYEYHCQFGEDHSDLVVRDVDKTASDQRPHGTEARCRPCSWNQAYHRSCTLQQLPGIMRKSNFRAP